MFRIFDENYGPYAKFTFIKTFITDFKEADKCLVIRLKSIIFSSHIYSAFNLEVLLCIILHSDWPRYFIYFYILVYLLIYYNLYFLQILSFTFLSHSIIRSLFMYFFVFKSLCFHSFF